MHYYFTIHTGFGNMVAAINKDGAIHGLWFEGQNYYPDITNIPVYDTLYSGNTISGNALSENAISGNIISENALPGPTLQTVSQLTTQLTAYERGTLQAFDLPLEPKGTSFQQAVWQLLTTIDYGTTTTYGALATRLAKTLHRTSMSAQAVGQAVGRNPISILIPCHRVLGSNGSLTGYAGGMERKKALLVREGVL